MKALTDKIIDRLEELKNETGFDKDLLIAITFQKAISVIKEMEKTANFEEVARVAMKHLGDGSKYHAHHSMIITVSSAKIVTDSKGTGYIDEYIPD